MTSSRGQDTFSAGLLCGVLLMVGSDGVHWFISASTHPFASPARSYAVAAQVLVGFAGALLLFFRMRRRLHRRASA